MDQDGPGRGDDLLTIDQLAAATNMTVRNIRAHQSRGLLPPPQIIGRTGWYGPLHRRRLDQIRRMQDEGLNLAAIAKVLIDGRLTDVAAGVFREEAEPVPDLVALVERLGVAEGDAERAVEVGILAVDGDELKILSTRLIAVAEQLVELGVPLHSQLDAVAAIRAAVQPVAAAFLGLADQHLLTRLAVDTQSDLGEFEATVERLHGLAAEAVLAVFDQAMTAEVERFIAELGGATG
jgi:DNA-binding transcriptional MerR regulator